MASESEIRLPSSFELHNLFLQRNEGKTLQVKNGPDEIVFARFGTNEAGIETVHLTVEVPGYPSATFFCDLATITRHSSHSRSPVTFRGSGQMHVPGISTSEVLVVVRNYLPNKPSGQLTFWTKDSWTVLESQGDLTSVGRVSVSCIHNHTFVESVIDLEISEVSRRWLNYSFSGTFAGSPWKEIKGRVPDEGSPTFERK